MSIFSNSISNMDEDLRFAYLQAMDVACWVPKDLNPVEEQPSSQTSIKQLAVKPVSLVNFESNQQQVDSRASVNAIEIENKEQQVKQENTESREQIEKQDNNTRDSQTICFDSNQFLKLVKWSNQTLKEEGAKRLLIICRHQIDQPANSFARSNSPSQFMLDYINTFTTLLDSQSFELQVQMAHLSEAGLGTDSVNMNDVLQQSSPDLILVLGDETVNQLSGTRTQVASHRGRLISLGEQYHCLVSYHPYSLIENPSLKSLAFEDLCHITQYFMRTS